MATLNAMDDGEISRVVRALSDLAWPLGRGQAHGFVESFDWKVEQRDPFGIEFSVNLGFARGDIDVDDAGNVMRISIPLTSYVDNRSRENRGQLQDFFVHALQLLTTTLGEPTTKIPGDLPEVRWRDREVTFVLFRASVMVELFMSSNEVMDAADRFQSNEG